MAKLASPSIVRLAAPAAVTFSLFDANPPNTAPIPRINATDADGTQADLAGWLDLPGGPKRIQNIAKTHSFEAVPEKRKGPGKVRRSATPGGWREGLTSEEQEMAQEIMGSRLVELGYGQ